MLKRFLKRVPGIVFLYVRARAFIAGIKRWSCKCGSRCEDFARAHGRWVKRAARRFHEDYSRAYKSIVKRVAWRFENALKKRERRNFVREVEKWSFDQAFSDLLKFAEYDHDYLEAAGNRLVKKNRTNPKGYALIQACCEYKPKKNHYDVGLHALAVGSELVDKGKLKEARAFFLCLQKIFPVIFEPYVILYDLIYRKQEEYRAAPARVARPGQKKPLILSFTVWGDKYIAFFCNYCIPSILAEGNLPAVAKIRDLFVDIYAHPKDISNLKAQEMVQVLSRLCEINFIEFPERMITCEEYKRNDAAFRYNIYGGFHHVSVERARAMEADVMCLGPDNIYADCSFLNYVKFVDEGFGTVLFTSTRAQAEFLVPVLDAMKDPSTKTLSITADEMVEFSARYIHHSFLQYINIDGMTPVWRSAFFIPHKHGFHIRCFHYHPVIIAASAIDRAKDIPWNYTTVDANLLTALFPNRKDWEKIKVITDSKDGVMLDVAYGSPGLHRQEMVEFSESYLDKTRAHFNENHFWNFRFVVNYKMEKEINGVRAYLYGEDGVLQPKEFPLTAKIEEIRRRVDAWYDSRA